LAGTFETRRSATAADLPEWKFYDLRRSFQTGLVRIGVPPHIADRRTAHKQKGVSAVYDRNSYAPEMATAWERWSAHIEKLAEPGA
jgi:hypothetical protein